MNRFWILLWLLVLPLGCGPTEMQLQRQTFRNAARSFANSATTVFDKIKSGTQPQRAAQYVADLKSQFEKMPAIGQDEQLAAIVKTMGSLIGTIEELNETQSRQQETLRQSIIMRRDNRSENDELIKEVTNLIAASRETLVQLNIQIDEISK